MISQFFSASRHRLPAAALLLSSIAVAACDEDTTGPSQTAQVQILLTDAPADMLDSAHVWISQVYLVGGGGEEPDTAEAEDTGESGRVDLYNDPANPLVFDLLQLRDGVTADLTGLVDVDPTRYQGLRFVIDSARVTLIEDLTFEDGSRVGVLSVPSGSTSGIKVKIDDVLEVAEDETLTVTVDLDVDENFTIQVDQQSGDVRSVRFRPVLREAARNRQR